MAMKQTQTKMFDFADVGLDFCSGSKNLFPDRFKKMLSQGYNEQTVASVSVTGNQVTLNYGVAHGYAADRVLKINSGPLAAINGGEFYIDSVTTNTATMTIDGAPTSIPGGFSTRIAPLGWDVVYESGLIHIYQFKDLDESDLYLRLAFQPGEFHRNTVMPCIGRLVDLINGTITDQNAYANGKSGNNSAKSMPKWDFTANFSGTYNNYSYNQGLSVFGKGVVVGSLYHILIMSNIETYNPVHTVLNGFVPCSTLSFGAINLPMLFTYATSTSAEDIRSSHYGESFCGYVGNTRVSFIQDNVVSGMPFKAPQAFSSFTQLAPFNTTTTEPISIYEYSTKQFLGFVAGGAYIAKYAATNQPVMTRSSAPSKTYEIDFENPVYLHGIGSYSASSTALVVIAVPVEEIKIGA